MLIVLVAFVIQIPLNAAQCTVYECQTCPAVSWLCTSCYGNYYLKDSSTCIPCQRPCNTCSGSPTYCITCVDNANQSPPSCSCTNPNLTIDNVWDDYYCRACTYKCTACNSFNVCTACREGWYLSGTDCLYCEGGCQTCVTNATNCITCVDPTNQYPAPSCLCTTTLRYLNRSCPLCVSPCLTCTSYYDCLSCVSDSYLLQGTRCNPCTKPCATCSGSLTQCTSCVDSLNQSSPTCACITGKYMNTLFSCSDCQTLCATCTSASACSICFVGYYLSGTVCIPCTKPCDSCSGSATNCSTCIDPNQTIPSCNCNNGYLMDSFTQKCIPCKLPCISCENTISNCQICNDIIYQSIPNCSCQSTYYQDTNYMCQSCLLPCLNCIGPLDCTSCANPHQSLNQNTCICDDGYYMDSFYLCQLMGTNCDIQCLTCTYPSYCTSCYQRYYLEKNGKCLECKNNCKICNDFNICQYCNDGYLEQNYNCIHCDKNCLTCIDFIDNCLSCKQNEQLIENKCYCDSQTIKSLTDTCIKCEYPCLLCQNESNCEKCAQIDRLYINSQNQCVCEEGYTWQNNECQIICPQNCFQCLDGMCLECYENYSLNNNQCSKIIQCGNGQLDEQEQCDDGNDVSNDGCSLCKIEENWHCNTETPTLCTYFESPYLIVTYLNQTSQRQYVNLEFSQKIWIDSKYNLSENININLISLSEENYFATIYTIKEASNNLSFAQYQIAIDIQQQLQEKPILRIQLNQEVYNEYGIPLGEKIAEIYLKIQTYLNPEQKQKAQTASNTNQNLIYGLGAISALSLFMGEVEIFQEILKLLQYQSYLKFINLEYPENLEIFFQSTNIVSVSAIVKYTKLNYYLTKYSLKQGPLTTDGKFAFYSYDADLITNLSCQLIQFSILVIVGLSTKILQGKFYNQINNNLFIKWMNDLHNQYTRKDIVFGSLKLLYTLILSIFKVAKQFSKQGLRALFLLNSQDLIFKALIYLHYMQFNSIRNIIQAAIATIIISSYITLIFVTQLKTDLLFTCQEKDKLQVKFDIMVLARQTLFISLIVLFQANQIIQTILITLTNIVYFVQLKRKAKMGQFFHIISQINEFLVILFMIASFFFFNDLSSYFSQEFKTNTGWSQIAILCMCLILQASQFIMAKSSGLIKYIKNKIKEQKNKEKADPIKQFFALPM